MNTPVWALAGAPARRQAANHSFQRQRRPADGHEAREYHLGKAVYTIACEWLGRGAASNVEIKSEGMPNVKALTASTLAA